MAALVTGDPVWDELQKENDKLERIRKEEDDAYFAYTRLRSARDRQEREVSYLFRKYVDRDNK